MKNVLRSRNTEFSLNEVRFFFSLYHQKEFQLKIFLNFRSKNFTKKIKPPYPQHKERSSKPLKLLKGTSNGWKIIMKWSKHGWKSKNKKEIWVETKFFLVSKEDSSSIYKYKKSTYYIKKQKILKCSNYKNKKQIKPTPTYCSISPT